MKAESDRVEIYLLRIVNVFEALSKQIAFNRLIKVRHLVQWIAFIGETAKEIKFFF